jgi:serralysin
MRCPCASQLLPTDTGTIADLTFLPKSDRAANWLNGGAALDPLTGKASNDFINGQGGADILIGGVGDDTYVVDHGEDRVIEKIGEGIDTVFSGAGSYMLPERWRI